MRTSVLPTCSIPSCCPRTVICASLSCKRMLSGAARRDRHGDSSFMFSSVVRIQRLSILLLLSRQSRSYYHFFTHHIPQAAVPRVSPCAPVIATLSSRAVVPVRCSYTVEEVGGRYSLKASRVRCWTSIRVLWCRRYRYRCSALEALRVVAVHGVCRPWFCYFED